MNNGFVTDGTEFRINTYLTNGQYPETVTGLSNGGFVVTWRSEGQDGSGSSTPESMMQTMSRSARNSVCTQRQPALSQTQVFRLPLTVVL